MTGRCHRAGATRRDDRRLGATCASCGSRPRWRVVVAVVGVLAYLYDNLDRQPARPRASRPDFDFLDRPATHRDRLLGLPRQPAGARRHRSSASRTRCSLASVGHRAHPGVGTLVGVARLSTNCWCGRRPALYVETLRNVPPLLVIVFVNVGGLPPAPGDRRPVRPRRVLLSVQPGAGRRPRRGRLGGPLPARAVAASPAWPRRWPVVAGAPAVARRPARPHHRVRVGAAGRWPWSRWPATSPLDGPIVLSHPEVDGPRGSAAGSAMSIGYGAVADGPRPLHVEPRRRDRAGHDPGGRPRAVRGGRRAWACRARSGSATWSCRRRSASRCRR